MVVESDTLGHDEVGAVFAYLRRRLRHELHCIIDTAGKSLHGWFDAPRNKVLENRLKAGLEVFGCDPKVFTYSQPVRVPVQAAAGSSEPSTAPPGPYSGA